MADFDNFAKEANKTRLVNNDAKDSKDSLPEIADLPAQDFFDLMETSTIDELEDYIQSLESDSISANGQLSLQKDLVSGTPKNFVSIVLWWELRRPLFNLIVGVCGLVALIALSILNNAPGAYLIFGAFTYFVTINVMYTFAWVIESIVHMILGNSSRSFGPKLYKLGTIFAVMVTLAISILLPLTMLVTNPFG